MHSRENGNLVNNCQIRQLYDETPASAGVNMSGAASDGKTVKYISGLKRILTLFY
jgi:hypothetical protein